MSNINSVNIVIPPAILDQAKIDIKKGLDALKPYTIAITPEERRTVPKMGDKTLAFVMKVQEYATNVPEFAPKFMNVPEFDTDVKTQKMPKSSNPFCVAETLNATI